MEIIVVSDTNIFIDLVKLDLLGDFFSLPWEVHTTDFVINELSDPDQNAAVSAFIKRNRLQVGKLSAEDVALGVELLPAGSNVVRRYGFQFDAA